MIADLKKKIVKAEKSLAETPTPVTDVNQTEPVDHPVRQFGRDDFAPQPMRFDIGLEPDAHRFRKCVQQFADQTRIVRHGGLFEFLLNEQLGAGQQHRQFGPGQPAPVSGNSPR